MLKDLNLQGVPWFGLRDNITTFDQFQSWAARYQPTKALPLAVCTSFCLTFCDV